MGWNSKATDEQPLWFVPEGEYELTVEKAEEKLSKKGDDMIELTLRVNLPAGNGPALRDFLFDPAAKPEMKWRSDSFALAAGLAANKGDDYQIDTETMFGLNLRAQLGVVEETYFDQKTQANRTIKKNKIERMLPRTVSAGAATRKPQHQAPPETNPFADLDSGPAPTEEPAPF
jgi:hypothetical protein